MIYIFCALYAEAAGLIDAYSLKKKQNNDLKFDLFENEEKGIRLILTGSGQTRAAVAAASVCTYYRVDSDDRIINIGTCAGNDEIGSLAVANRIVDASSGRVYYPDMLLKTGISEKTVETSAGIVNITDVMHAGEGIVFDMEAAGIYEAAVFFTGQECISVLKVVSDAGHRQDDESGHFVSPQEIKDLFGQKMSEIREYIELVRSDVEKQGSCEYAGDIEEQVSRLSDDMHCSQTMQNRLRQLIKYAELVGIDLQKTADSLYDEGLLPAKNKNAGKQVLDELEKRLL